MWRLTVKGRGGWAAELRIETDMLGGLRRDEWICKICDEGEVEDVEHFYCTVMVWQRRERRW